MIAGPKHHPGWALMRFIVLIGCLCAPVIGGLLRVSPPAQFQDMRALTSWPKWSALPFHQWTAAYDGWLNDHFPLRARIITWNAFVRHRFLHAPSTYVVVGRDGWLFYSGDRTLEDWVGRDRFTDAELRARAEVMEGRYQWLKRQGVRYLFVIAPNKSTVYPDYLPPLLRAQHRPGKLDQLVAYLQEHTHVPLLDLRPTMAALRQQRDAYWQTDTHWNGYGHFAAYVAIMDRLKAMGVAQRAADDAQWIQIADEPRNTDLIALFGMTGYWPTMPIPVLHLGGPPDLKDATTALSSESAVTPQLAAGGAIVTTERASGRGKAVLICDSFFRVGGLPSGGALAVPFMLSFRRFVSAWSWRPGYPAFAAIVRDEHPDVVIEEETERFLREYLLEDSPEFARARAAAAAEATGRGTPDVR